MTMAALHERFGAPVYCEYHSRCVWLGRRHATSLVAEGSGGLVRRLITFSPGWRTAEGVGLGTTLTRLRRVHPGGALRGLDRMYELRSAGPEGRVIAARFLISATSQVYAVDLWDTSSPDLAHGQRPDASGLPSGTDLQTAAAVWGSPAGCDATGRCSWWSLEASDTVAWASFDPAGRVCRVAVGTGAHAPPSCATRVGWLAVRPGPPTTALVQRRSIAGVTLRMTLPQLISRWGPPLSCAFEACTFANPRRLPVTVGVEFGRSLGLLLDGISTTARTWRTLGGSGPGRAGAPLLREFRASCRLAKGGQPRIQIPSNGGRVVLLAPLNATRIEGFDLVRNRCYPSCRASC